MKWKPEQQIKLVADSIEELRPEDLARLMDDTPRAHQFDMACEIIRYYIDNERMMAALDDWHAED
jgi:hypothetical protein